MDNSSSIPPSSGTPKWTEIEHLPEWDEEFYHVYTAKKYGKWLMLKTLRPELKGVPEYEEMIEKEFDVRYNLAHPHIIMINDFEEVPGLGMCIITDDVYGDSLAKLIKEKKVVPSRILFTENIGNLKLIDVGFDQKSHITPADASQDIYNYGKVLMEALDAVDTPYPLLRKVAEKCINPDPDKRYKDIAELRLALADRHSNKIYLFVIAFLVIMMGILLWLNSPYRPIPGN